MTVLVHINIDSSVTAHVAGLLKESEDESSLACERQRPTQAYLFVNVFVSNSSFSSHYGGQKAPEAVVFAAF